MDDISAALISRGVAAERVRTERFGTIDVQASGVVARRRRAPHPPAGRPGAGPQVPFARSNLSVPWPDGQDSLLDEPGADGVLLCCAVPEVDLVLDL